MALIDRVVLEVADVEAAERFHAAALGLDDRLRLRHSDAPAEGFRGFTMSLIVSQPADADAFVDAALGAGATALKPPKKSLWGYGGAVQAPDGTIWTVASSARKNSAPPARRFDDLVLQLGVEDVGASKRFYVDRGFEATKSFGRRYVEFAPPSSPVKLAFVRRRALARVAGVDPAGIGSHRLLIAGDAGPFTDPDGFTWTAAER